MLRESKKQTTTGTERRRLEKTSLQIQSGRCRGDLAPSNPWLVRLEVRAPNLPCSRSLNKSLRRKRRGALRRDRWLWAKPEAHTPLLLTFYKPEASRPYALTRRPPRSLTSSPGTKGKETVVNTSSRGTPAPADYQRARPTSLPARPRGPDLSLDWVGGTS